MEIKNKTPYTYETLMEFNSQHRRKLVTTMTVIICVCAGIVLLAVITSVILSALEIKPFNTQSACAATVYILIAVFLLLWPFLRRKKICTMQAANHIVANCTFTEESFIEDITSDTVNSHSENKYSVITGVTESTNAFYLYIAPNTAHIVAKDGFTEGNEEDFRILLQTVIEPKKLHIR
ncbi:MAG: YcxB family protein [Clostridia bacterium]|nr:YcxB family protein [Clostridia bacterium]